MLKVELIGNLGADVEVKESNGSQFATFRVADTSRYKTQSGEDKEVTYWIDCSYNNVESKVLPYLKAGVKVFVRGNASLRVYSSKKDRCMKAGYRFQFKKSSFAEETTTPYPAKSSTPRTVLSSTRPSTIGAMLQQRA